MVVIGETFLGSAIDDTSVYDFGGAETEFDVCWPSFSVTSKIILSTPRACERGFRGYIVLGPGPRGPGLKEPGRVQVSALNVGIAP